MAGLLRRNLATATPFFSPLFFGGSYATSPRSRSATTGRCQNRPHRRRHRHLALRPLRRLPRATICNRPPASCSSANPPPAMPNCASVSSRSSASSARVHFLVRLDVAGQYADNLLHFLHTAPRSARQRHLHHLLRRSATQQGLPRRPLRQPEVRSHRSPCRRTLCSQRKARTRQDVVGRTAHPPPGRQPPASRRASTHPAHQSAPPAAWH